MFSVKSTQTGRPRRGRPSRSIRQGLSLMVGLLVLIPTAINAQPALETQIRDDAILATLPEQPDLETPPRPQALSRQVRSLLQRARSSGDPRYLGYADQALERRPQTDWSPRLHVLKATLDQSLHRFEEAGQRLRQVLDNPSTPAPIASQAWLTLATLETTRGRYESARQACDGLANHRSGLIAQSCHARIQALTGHAESAYETLSEALEQGAPLNTEVGRHWARVIQAEIATQTDHPRTDQHWRLLLQQSPDDLISRTAYADWLLRQNRPSDVLELTDGYESVEALAVLRAVAFERLPDHSDQALKDRLRQAFQEAQWRGSGQHHRTLARFLLEVEQQPKKALIHARKNWDNQREPLDTTLLLEAARAADAPDTVSEVRQWLNQHQQTDARYPESRS